MFYNKSRKGEEMSSFYTTGDLAKLAGVSVRTVQYYDKRGILTPSDVTEGGRRLYVASDLEQLRMICFLRELDFSIDQIKRILAEENAKQVLELLLVEHIKEMKQDLSERKAKLDTAVNLLDKVKNQSGQSLAFLSDISLVMRNQHTLKQLHRRLFFYALCNGECFALDFSAMGNADLGDFEPSNTDFSYRRNRYHSFDFLVG